MVAQVSNHYALIMGDPPVAERYATRAAIGSASARLYRSTIESRQQVLKSQLAARNFHVVGSVSIGSNAVFVVAPPSRVDELKAMPGVIGVIRMRVFRPTLNKAVPLLNGPAAWTALGGSDKAGAGMKIGILDTGIDQNNPAFQDSSLSMPSGFPLCNSDTSWKCSDFTSNKVIVARSYIRQSSAGSDPNNVAADSMPDDYSPRDRVGHGTAVASCAAAAPNSGGVVAFSGMAPKAYLGNYKVQGSPGVSQGASEDAIATAIEDAFTDGMDVVNFSLGSMAITGPLDTGAMCGNPAGVPCDFLAYNFEQLAQKGLVIAVAAGNDGFSSPVRFPPVYNLMSSPANAPSVLGVGATINGHVFLPSVSVPGGPAALQNLSAQTSDAWAFGPVGASSAPLVDVSQIGDGYACSALPAHSLDGKFALIEQGPATNGCTFATKASNASNAGAAGIVFYMQDQSAPIIVELGPNGGTPTFFGPVVMVSNQNGVALKSYADAHSGAAAIIDPSGTEQDLSVVNQMITQFGGTNPPLVANQLATFSSTGPNEGDFAVKPDLVSIGGFDLDLTIDPNDFYLTAPSGLYMAAQSYDPAGELYSSTGYAAANGTSFSSPLVAGAAALVKQNHPSFRTAEIRSALINAAAQDTTTDDMGDAVDMRSVGGGRLDAGAAVGATVTADPATLSFGALNGATLPISKSIKISNPNSVPLSVAVVPAVAATGASVAASLASGTVTVTLSGSVPAAGYYSGAITITGAGVSLRVPYQFLVGDLVPFDAIPIVMGQASTSFEGIAGQDIGPIGVKVVDQYGVTVTNSPVTFGVRPAGGLSLASVAGEPACTGSATVSMSCSTDTYGIAWTDVTLGSSVGSTPGISVRAGTVPPFTIGGANGATVLAQPTVPQGRVLGAANGESPVAPGSYIAIYGSGLVNPDELMNPGGDSATTVALPLALDGTTVSFDFQASYDGKPADYNGLPGRLTYVSPNQVNVWVPWEAQGQSSAQVKVVVDGLAFGNAVTVPIAPYAPALFEANGIVAAIDATTNSILLPGTPAHAGDAIELFANGLGPVNNQPASGTPAPGPPNLATTKTTPIVMIGGQQAPVSFSGLAPGYPGLYQVNVTVPSGAGSGTPSITIAIGGQTSKASKIPVQ
jgi:minor extracellular serine protease Vpr